MESLPITTRLRCQSSLAFGGMTYFFHTLPFVRTKGRANRRQAESNHACMNCRGAKEENKRSAVKNRRGETISGRPCACAESYAFGTFEAIKRFPILNAPSPRPPSARNRFCRGIGLPRVNIATRRVAQFAAAPRGGLQLADGSCASCRRRRTAGKNETHPRHSTFFFCQKEK